MVNITNMLNIITKITNNLYNIKKKMKKEYCEKNNIKYLCIPYNLDNIQISLIINKFFNN